MQAYLEFQWGMSVVVCIYLSGKELHRQVGVDKVDTLGSLDGVMVSTLAQNVRDVGLIPPLCAILPIVITTTTIAL